MDRAFLRRVVIVGIVLFGVWMVTGRPQATPGGEPQTSTTAWTPPAGFTAYRDTAVAYQWIERKFIPCKSQEHCWAMNVVARDGCDSLYVELSVSDQTGTAIDYTNGILSALAPGQPGRLQFQSFDDAAADAKLAEIRCE